MSLNFQSLIRLSVLAAVSALSFAIAAQADIVAAKEEPILTIDGAVSQSDGFDLDLASLQQFEPTTFKTTTIWTEGELTFTGVPLKALIEAAGATGTTVVAEALNGYAVEIPVSELADSAPIIAYYINGEVFSRRDKGPLWVVFPWDLEEKYKSETAYSYSIWQLRRLTIK